jgi:ubiquinone/menaquinone biosynthesis C-methylase UbiE
MTATTDRMATWVAEHGRYDAMLADYERALIDTATLAPGERVLDVGCGTGTTTLDAAAAVGPNGSVLGIDLSEVALARARERAAGIGNVFFEHGDVCEHPLGDAHFDVVISRFAVMLFAHPERAHRKLLRSLRPGGRFVATVWRERAVNAWMSLPMAAVAEHVAGLPEPAARTPCAFAFAEPARVRSVLGEAGFTDVTLAEVASDAWVGRDVADAIAFFEAEEGTSLRALFGPETVSAIEASLRSRLADHVTADGVRLPSSAWLVTARCG